MYSMPLLLGVDVDVDILETVQELLKITCVKRAFTAITDNKISIHFESAEDIFVFVDSFDFFLKSMDEE